MIKIKMDDVFTVEADYERLIISLLGEDDTLMGTIEYSSIFQVLEQYSEFIQYFMESIEGKNINIYLPPSQKVFTTKKSYGTGNLFMEYSSGEKL